MNTRVVAGMMALVFASTAVAAFAQKSRRVVREEGLSVQTTAPVDGTTTTGGGASPEIYGTDGGATKSAIPGQTAGTGLVAVTGRSSDNTATLLSAGRGGVVTPVVAATAVTGIVPTTSSDQSMLPMLLGALASALGGGGAKTNGSTNTAATNNNPNTASTTNNNTTPAANTTPASTSSNPANATPAVRNDQADAKKCADYKDADKDKITPPFRSGLQLKSCTSDPAAGGPYALQLQVKKGGGQNINVYPIASGKIVAIDKNTAYKCRVVIKHDTCPIVGVAASGPCYSSYGDLDVGEDGKCPKDTNFTTLPADVTKDTKIGHTKTDKKSKIAFEMRTTPDKVALTKTYECAITRFAEGSSKNSRCSATASDHSRDHVRSDSFAVPPKWNEGTR